MYLILTEEFWTHQNIVLRNQTKSKQILCLLSIKFRQRYIFASCTYGKLKTDIFLWIKLYPWSKLGTFTVLVFFQLFFNSFLKKFYGTQSVHLISHRFLTMNSWGYIPYVQKYLFVCFDRSHLIPSFIKQVEMLFLSSNYYFVFVFFHDSVQ